MYSVQKDTESFSSSTLAPPTSPRKLITSPLARSRSPAGALRDEPNNGCAGDERVVRFTKKAMKHSFTDNMLPYNTFKILAFRASMHLRTRATNNSLPLRLKWTV